MHHPVFHNQEVHEIQQSIISVRLAHFFNKLGVNAGIIETPDSTVFIDAGTSAYSGEFLWSLAEERLDVNKELYLIITHRDTDHYLGMNAMRRRGAKVIAHKNAAKEIHVSKDSVRERYSIRLNEKFGSDDMLGDFVISYPDQIITDDFKLCDGEIQILVIPGHTSGDIAVFHPRSRILFTGDAILEGMNPKIHDDSLSFSIWISNLERLKNLGAECVVPGHGAISKPDIIDENIQFLRKQMSG